MAIVPTSLTVAACNGSTNEGAGNGGGSTGFAGAIGAGGSTAGAAGTSDSVAGMGGTPSGGPGTGGGSTVGAGGNSNVSSGNGGTIGIAGGSSSGGGGASGVATAGAGGDAMTGSGGVGVSTGGDPGAAGGSAGATSKEDDGTDCAIPALPDSGSLPSIAKLPDPFKKLDGSRIATKNEWRCRREEIKKQAEKYAYGTKPPKPQSVGGTVSNTKISVTAMDNGKSSSFSATVVLPSGGSPPYPVIIVYGGLGLGFGIPMDASVINGEGVALIDYDVGVTGKEGTPRSNKQGAFYDIVGSNSSAGLLIAWSWGVSRMIDVIEQSDGKLLKADAVAVTGCSRFGKGAFIAGAFDQRIPLTMPIESGTGGVPIWRGIADEGAQSLSSAYGEQPWFGDAFSAFTGNPAKAPIDTHEVVGMIAPRGLFVMDNPSIANLGPRAGSVGALAGAEVYKALGAEQNVSYYSDIQNGSHCAMRPEWSAPLRSNIRKFLTKTGNDAGVMKISGSAMGNVSTWVDWTTPQLN